MLERSIETALREIADKEQPHSRISIQRALRDGRARLHRRRLVRAVGTPVLAAAAVLAIALPVSMPAGGHHATHERAVVVPARPATSRHFSPLALYASFGWLPANNAGLTTWGQMQATSEALYNRAWDLRTYAVGRCKRLGNRTGRAIRPQRDHGLGPGNARIDCGWPVNKIDWSCLGNAYIQARAPAIDGRPAYWAYDLSNRNWARIRCLAWEYRPGGWAYLMNSGEINPSERLMVRVASAVRFGGHQPSFKFAAQLRKLPGRWQVVLPTDFGLTDGALLAGGYTITDGKTTIFIDLNFSPTHNKCLATNHVCRVINGYYVTVNRTAPATKGGPQGFEISAPDADNAFVQMFGSAPSHGPGSYKLLGLMYTVFSHMKMLGTNPADWTTKPIR